MSKFNISEIEYEFTGKRTDDNSWWRKLFGENKVGHYWGQPYAKLTKDLTFTLGNPDNPFFSRTIKEGFVCDLGTAPGIFGTIIGLSVKWKLLAENTERSAVLHDILWAEADAAGEDVYTAYKIADEIFLNTMLMEGQPFWYAIIVFGVVRFVANAKIFSRWLGSKLRK